MKREYWILLFVGFYFMVVGHVEVNEPVPHYAQIECGVCHMPNLSTYKSYAQAWPSPAERGR